MHAHIHQTDWGICVQRSMSLDFGVILAIIMCNICKKKSFNTYFYNLVMKIVGMLTLTNVRIIKLQWNWEYLWLIKWLS